MRFFAAESLLLAGLLFLSAFVFRTTLSSDGLPESTWIEALAARLPEDASVELVLGALLCIALYWTLHLLGLPRLAFWPIALLVMLSYGPAIWGHNQLELYRLFGLNASLGTVDTQIPDATLFLASLVGLVALYRVIGLRELNQQLSSQKTEDSDRNGIMLCETLLLLGLIGAALLLTSLIVLVATALARSDALLTSPPWTVLTVGGGAVLLLTLTLALWFRTRQEL